MELERDIAAFLGTQACIIYAQGFSTVSSVIPSFSKRGDVIVADRGVSFAVQKGIQISRSTIRWYDHNDMGSLERVLETLRREDIKYRRKLTRKFIVTEGLFEGDGQICDLPRIVGPSSFPPARACSKVLQIELKKRYKYRLVLEESWSIGTLGKTGRGLTEHFGIPGSEIDILVGSMANSFNSAGGFCAGSTEVVEHQRINSAAVVYSAALPPLLATSASETIAILRERGSAIMTALGARTATIRKTLDSIPGTATPSDPLSPLIHICLQPTTKSSPKTIVDLPFDQAESVLQSVVDSSLERGVLVARAKKVWEMEMDPMVPSLRICVSAALTDREAKQAAEVIKRCVVEAVEAIDV